MSWDSYVTNLTSGGIISQASIIGLNGSIWTPPGANAAVMNVAQGEATTIGTTMAKKDDSVKDYFADNELPKTENWKPRIAMRPQKIYVYVDNFHILATFASMHGVVPSSKPANGITVGGIRYLFLRDLEGDGRVMTGKKKDHGNIVVASTVQAVIIAFIPEAKADSARSANTAVQNMVKYLEGTGY